MTFVDKRFASERSNRSEFKRAKKVPAQRHYVIATCVEGGVLFGHTTRTVANKTLFCNCILPLA